MPHSKERNANDKETDQGTAEVPYCGIVMPISAMGDYSKDHWSRVKIIIERAILKAGYRPRLVSENEAVSVIQANIVRNLYDDSIIVCDVSGKNPNVMLELGLRLAFDKPVVIIKDETTDYSFDASPIQHLGYERNLRYDSVEEFIERLSKSIIGTMAVANKDDDYSPFLRHFDRTVPRKITSTEVDGTDYLTERIASIENSINTMNSHIKILSDNITLDRDRNIDTFDDAIKKYISERKSATSKLSHLFDSQYIGARRYSSDPIRGSSLLSGDISPPDSE